MLEATKNRKIAMQKKAQSLFYRPGEFRRTLLSGRRKQPKDKVFGQDIPGTSGTQTSGCPGQKLHASGFFLLFKTRSGRDVPEFGSGRPGYRSLQNHYSDTHESTILELFRGLHCSFRGSSN